MAGPDSPAAAVPRRTAGAPPLPARPGARPAPRLTPIRHVLPDGVFHGYLYTTPGARKCRPTLPTGRCVRCAIHRGRSKGCGDTVFRNRPTILCLQGVYRQCQVGGDGTVKRCGGVYSGWTITHRRGVLRRCCIRQGKVKYCTNAADYVCTPAERR
jgi:hypothetical protein